MPLDAGRVACITKTYLEARNIQHFLVEHDGQLEVGGAWCLGILREKDYSCLNIELIARHRLPSFHRPGKRLTAQVCHCHNLQGKAVGIQLERMCRSCQLLCSRWSLCVWHTLHPSNSFTFNVVNKV
jgi:hypothetical protein